MDHSPAQEKLEGAAHEKELGNETEHVAVVQNVAFTDALSKSRVNPWSRRMLQLYCICFVATLNSCINGYDGSLMSAINAMDSYKHQFHTTETGARTGFIFAIYTVGNIVGSFIAGPLTDTWGRRWGMFLGATFIIVGTCIQAPADSLAQFKGGRFLLGVGVALSATAGPSYLAEMAHPKYRGVMTAMYNSFWFVGGIPASWVTYGTNKAFGIENNAWRIPLFLQMSFSGVIFAFAFFLPESPRWLLANDRQEEALAVMAKYHGDDNADSPIVQLEYAEMREQISLTGSDKRWWDYSELVKTRGSRYRLMLVTSMGFFGQWSGNAAISYFFPTMLENAGIHNTNTKLLLNGVSSIISFIGAIIGAQLVDRVGRRPMLLTASILFVCCFTIVLGLTAKYGNDAADKNGSNAGIAFIYLFSFIFSISFTPFQALYPVECLNFETRAKGMAVYNFWVNVAGFFNQYVTPIGLGNVQWKFYGLYIAWDAMQAVFIWFFYVETKNRTLEELNDIFNAPNPKKESLKKKKVAIDGKHGVTETLEHNA